MMLTFNEWGYSQPAEQPIPLDIADIQHYFGTSSPQRQSLWASMEELLALIKKREIAVIDIWIDGSFTTLKLEPNDIDVAIFVPDKAISTRRSLFDQIDQQFEGLDLKWIPLYTETDKRSISINTIERMRWLLVFNSDRDENPKGVIKLNLFAHGADK